MWDPGEPGEPGIVEVAILILRAAAITSHKISVNIIDLSTSDNWLLSVNFIYQ